MSLDTILRNLFQHNASDSTRRRNTQATPPSRPAPARRPSPCIPKAHQRLLAQKLVGQMRTIDRTYDLKLLADIEAWVNDLAVMMANNDFTGISAELLDNSGKVFYAHRIDVIERHGKPELYSDGGMALPILDRSRLGKARIVVHRKCDNQSSYASLLKLNWSNVERAERESGKSFSDTHANKTTGGHGKATVHVGDSLRVELTIIRSGGKGFAFATDESGNLAVFCHAKHAPDGYQFKVGSKISAVLVQLPKGIQAREIQPAA